MKQIVRIKQSSSIQLAHLYEHIFCTQIDKLFYKNGLFPHVDYVFTGQTYYRGAIYICLQLFTDKAIEVSSQVSHLKTSFNQDSISTAASQLIAEKEYAFESQGYDEVKKALKDLDDKSWIDLDASRAIDTQGTRRKAQPFYILDDIPLPARKLTVDIQLDKDFATSHRHLLPLSRQIAILISMTIQNTVADEYGYYSDSDIYKEDVHTISNIFKVPDRGEVNIQDIISTCVTTVKDLQNNDAFVRLCNELRETSLYERPNDTPTPDATFIDTGIFIGAKGWREIATRKNYKLLPPHLSVEVKYGRSHNSCKLFNS